MSDRMKNKAAREEMAKPQAVRSSFIVRRSSLHSAFSMIEIMVAIVIIAILAAIAMVAYKGVVGGNQNNQTKAMLGSLRGMLIE
ncbi:MAG TPA: prepilin-type N-terminal cleavage/methylation domain-containing protein, partial [Tepidisphaeraceae bacterium]